MSRYRVELYRPQYMTVEVEADGPALAKERAVDIAVDAPDEDWSEPGEFEVWSVEED